MFYTKLLSLGYILNKVKSVEIVFLNFLCVISVGF